MQLFTDTIHRIKRLLPVMLALTAALLAALSLGQAATAAESNNGPMPGPGVSAHKWASSSIVAGGQTFSYTIALRNMTNVDVTATVTDPLPMPVAYVTGSATGGAVYDAGTRTLIWPAITVAANSEVRLTFDATAADLPAPTTVINEAKIAVNSRVMSAPAWVMIVPATGFPSRLERSYKMASSFVVRPGDPVTYTIKLINFSPLSATASVTDPVSAQLTYVDGSATGGGTYDAGSRTLSWADVVVPPFGHAALTFSAVTPGDLVTPTLITNVATIASGAETFERRAAIVVFNQPVPPPRPMLGGSYKSASQRIVAAGQPFTYTINLINSGTEDAIVDVTDPIPAEVNYVFNSASNDGVYDPAADLLAWHAITVTAGSSLPLTFVVSATTDITRPTPVENTATITVENPMTTTLFNSNVLHRTARVLLVPTPPTGDLRPPVVNSLTIGDQDVLTSPTVTLHISATDNLTVSRMFIREWQLTPSPRPHWEMIRASGWITYQPDYDWTLGSANGTHYVGAWVMDAAGNVSHLTRRAFDFASLVLPGASVAQHGLVPYLVYYDQGVQVTATLNSITGDADLYLWRPGNYFGPDHKSTQPLTGTDVITFTTPRAGLYLFIVRGYTAATYDLSIEPGGGPRVMWPWWPASSEPAAPSIDLAAPGAPSGKPDDLTYDSVLPESGLDPLSLAPTADAPYNLFLPTFVR